MYGSIKAPPIKKERPQSVTPVMMGAIHVLQAKGSCRLDFEDHFSIISWYCYLGIMYAQEQAG